MKVEVTISIWRTIWALKGNNIFANDIQWKHEPHSLIIVYKIFICSYLSYLFSMLFN